MAHRAAVAAGCVLFVTFYLLRRGGMSFSWRGKRCLVIGGAGNLGGCIVRMLLEEGAAVKCFDLAAYCGHREQDVHSVQGSVTDRGALDGAMAGMEVVFHTASIIDLRPRPSLRMQSVNVGGTFEVVQAAKLQGVHTLVYTASLEVVSGMDERGVEEPLRGVDEGAPIPVQHRLPYAATKAAAERLVLAAHGPGLRTCSIRPGYIMGAGCIGQRLELDRTAQRGGYYVTAKVPARLSTVAAKNCALAHLRAAERAGRADVGGHAFFVRDFEANVIEMNLQCFRSLPIKTVLLPLHVAYAIACVLHALELLIMALCSLLGRTRQTPEDVLDYKAAGMAWIDIVVSDRRARDVLGYAPLVSQAECLEEASEWCRSYYAKLQAKGS